MGTGEGQFVYRGWLEAKGGTAAVSDAVLAWVGTYGQTPDASFLYRAWLEAKGEIAAVSNAVLALIGTYGQRPMRGLSIAGGLMPREYLRIRRCSGLD